MSKLNLTRRTFLEKEELARFQQFLADSPSENAIIGNTSKWGILRTDFVTDTDFLVEPSANAGRVKIDKVVNKALTSVGLRAVQNAIDNIAITDDSAWYWLRIKHKYVNWESGVVSVNASGELTGIGTAFTTILRGQGTQVPVRIKFAKEDGSSVVNSGFYEVVDITSDTVAILTSAIEFQTETDLKMVVVGTTPVGESVTAEQEGGLYSYDSCEIEIVAEEELDTPPEIGFIQDQTFYIARVRNVGGFVTVEDKRTQWWEFNVVGLTDKLSIFSNLSDLNNADTALTNLGLTTVGKNIVKLNTSTSPVYIRINTNGTISRLTAAEVYSDLTGEIQGDFLQSENNLSDLTDVPEARTNLDVYGKSEVYTKTEVNNNDVTERINIPPITGFIVPDASSGLFLLKNKKTISLYFRLLVGPVSPTVFHVGIVPSEYRPPLYTIFPLSTPSANYIAAGIVPDTGQIQAVADFSGALSGQIIVGSSTWVIE